jgi:osmotically-inducible protein OsmY
LQAFIDTDIERDIENAYRRNILIDESQINVSVASGIVQLTGNVPNFLIKDEAIKIAIHTKGVQDIIDEIAIELR